VPRFKKKPLEVDAAQVEARWFRHDVCQRELPAPAGEQCVMIDKTWRMVYVKTPEGTMRASVGDWLVRGVKGEVYPVKGVIFARTFEPVP
jgi:hypothetical protein